MDKDFEYNTLVGIDYGSKMAGTTVIAYIQNNQICLLQSIKKKDADQFVLDFFKDWHIPAHVFLDAPLSLPGAFFGKGNDYFYRLADKAVQAMSPMFLGGLTARAIRLQDNLTKGNHLVKEVYPGYLARLLGLKEMGYKGDQTTLPVLSEIIAKLLPYPLEILPQNWHQFDALLALITGIRFANNQHQQFGDDSEGVIIV